MKRYLFTLFALVCATAGAWADDATITSDYKGAYIVTNGEGNLTVTTLESSTFTNALQWVNYVKVSGNINNSDVSNLVNANYSIDGNSNGGTVLDFSNATVVGDVTFTAKNAFKGVRLPNGSDLASYSGPQTFVYYVDADSVYLRIMNSTNGLNDFKLLSTTNSWANAPANGKTIYLSGDYGDFDEARTFLKNGGNAGASEVIKVAPVSNAPYTVSGCDVVINMAKAEARQTLDDLIDSAKVAVIAGGESGICTLTVQGELTNNDLIALRGSNMTGATRIDLSGATLGSGVTIDNLQIPASLQSLILPKAQTVSVGLASKLAAAANLDYAVSPTSSDQNASQAVADYIWVNKAGGLNTAITTESATLSLSHYIKVASSVALNTVDVNLNSRLDSVKYLDMSAANVTSDTVFARYTKPCVSSYRIILPDGWSLSDMEVFQDRGSDNYGSMAAVYSYAGTTLKIMEIDDNAYAETALKNPRIVRKGSTAIEVVGENIERSGSWKQYGNLGNNLIAALNQADDDTDDEGNPVNNIKSITINIGTAAPLLGDISFTNTNIETLAFTGVKNKDNQSTGPSLTVTGCTRLTTLDVSNSTLRYVDAHGLTSLTSVNLNGTLVTTDNSGTGTVNLSGTGLRTLTTNGSTDIYGNLNLAGTALTSFDTQAKIAGDINLNACSSLTSIDISATQFQNTTSKIHVHSTDDESDNNVISGLNNGSNTTILLPAPVKNNGTESHFDKTRIHPSSSLENNMGEAATTGSFEDDCNPKCHIDYDAKTGVATVYAYTPGHFKDLMEKDKNFSTFAEGTIFTFDASCKLNAADLAALAGDATNGNYNKFFVDLYDLPATVNGDTVKYENVIRAAIETLRTNDWQYRGLLLPKAVTTLGTTLIMDGKGTNTSLATCSESIAYSGTISGTSSVLTASYIYKATGTDWGISYLDRLLNLEKMMDLHKEIPDSTTHYSVSTNSPVPLDLSTLPTKVTKKDSGTEINTSKLETVNNDMVAGADSASIYAYPAYENVMAAVVAHTSIEQTPRLKMLKVTGPVNATDIASINQFTGGPRVFDLKGATTTISKTMLGSIANGRIQYIVLPAGMKKDSICYASYTDGLKAGLKTVISSKIDTLVAYVNTAGSLAEARYLATGGSEYSGLFSPAQTGLKSVTLAGNLDAGDISANNTTHFVDGSGHWKTSGSNERGAALLGEQGTITKIDLKDAVFGYMSEGTRTCQTDMNFCYAGLGSISDITLPTDATMTLIPEYCFNGIKSFSDLCIPYNYTHIDNAALLNTYCGHLTTTDANGAVVDNGAHTYTFSAHLEEIGSKPSSVDANGVYSLSENVFPQNRGVTDVYALAHKVPKCYAHSFPANMLYGWGGFKGGDFPYCREKYDNSSDGSLIFTVLHYPDSASFIAAASGMKETAGYTRMESKYTDITKVYTKKEQTGAVDANGRAIAWPTFSELRRVFNQATDGIIWDNWIATYDSNHEVNGGDNIPTTTQEVGSGAGNHSPLIKVTAPTKQSSSSRGVRREGTETSTGTTDDENYGFVDYEGWHQFVLSMATYVEPAKTVVNDTVKTNYVQGGWYTLCIPYSLTLAQAVEMLGVPASTGKVENKYGGSVVTAAMRPDVRTLKSVTRTPGTTNVVTLNFTKNLLGGKPEYWDINENDPANSTYAATGKVGEDSIAIRGGYPYLVRPYLPEGEVVNNLGKYIMSHYGKSLGQTQSCIHIDSCYQDLAAYSATNATGRFCKPFEHHKVQAYWDESGYGGYRNHSDGKKYNYTFVGQFWDQQLPRYSFYMVENSSNTSAKWYRLASEKNYKWNQYKCVIMVTPENNETDNSRSYLYTYSGKYRNNDATVGSNYPVSSGTDGKGGYVFSSSFYLKFLKGLDDSDFTEANGTSAVSGSSRYVVTFDDEGVADIDAGDGETTAIGSLDGGSLRPAGGPGKVYNVAGQYVGDRLSGLPKGMYIVNGKKVVVK